MFDICKVGYISDFSIIRVPKFSHITGRRISLECFYFAKYNGFEINM
jgi:hypothetical protein